MMMGSCGEVCDVDVIRCYKEVISEDLRATLNAFLYRTGEQSNKYVTNVHVCFSCS